MSSADLKSTPGVKAIADANIKLALDIYRKCAPLFQGQNLFFAPFSISTALALTLQGAQGETASQMVEVLRLPSLEVLLDGFEKYLSVLQAESAGNETGYVLRGAQRIYVNKILTLKGGFNAIAQKSFRADAQLADFAGNAEKERKLINEWVALQTGNKISELIPEGILNTLTAMVLIQALYFKGSWLHKFNIQGTTDGIFFAPQGEIPVKMMSQRRKFNYVNNSELGFAAVELPYAGGSVSESDLSMLILLPDAKDGLEELVNKLTPEVLNNLRASMHSAQVNLALPRFKVESSLKLKDVLVDLGMKLAFSDQADFSGLVEEKNPPLYISEVIHKAVVDVNEEGAEAAAATGITISLLCMPIYQDFIADHPFIFFIKDKRTNIVLFLGQLESPQ